MKTQSNSDLINLKLNSWPIEQIFFGKPFEFQATRKVRVWRKDDNFEANTKSKAKKFCMKAIKVYVIDPCTNDKFKLMTFKILLSSCNLD